MRRALLALVILVLAGCGGDAAIGARYRAERGLWRLDREAERLSIRPDLVTQDQWMALAGRYESLATSDKARVPSTPAGNDWRATEAVALVRSAQIHAALGDSTHMLELYSRVETDYADVPKVAGEVALARGKIAESRRDWTKAIAAYRSVLERVEPKADKVGVAKTALELPLHIARLAAVAAGDTAAAARAPHYREAESTYRSLIAAGDSATVAEAHAYLAQAASDLGDWPTALAEVRRAETESRKLTPPPREPASLRYSAAGIERRMGDERGYRATLDSLIVDYPKSSFAPRALLALADQAAGEGRTEDALTFLERVGKDYANEEDLAAQAMLARGRLLERADRWSEAQEVFRALPVDHPVTAAALSSPLEIAGHYERVGDTEGRRSALERAEAQYRDFLSRYPEGKLSATADQQLVSTLTLLGRKKDALDQMLGLSERYRGTNRGANYAFAAARYAYLEMGDTARAADILDRAAATYKDADFGRWAGTEAARLRHGGGK
jgi:tetratricopeptide (TPR) repeat protein